MRTPAHPIAAAGAALALTLTGCSAGGNTATTPPSATPTPPAVSADACRAYDSAIALVARLVEGEGAPGLAGTVGPNAAERVRHAAQLATGQGKTAMENTAARIQVLADKADAWTPADPAGPDAGREVAAVRESIVAVDKLCRAAGASLANVPAPI